MIFETNNHPVSHIAATFGARTSVSHSNALGISSYCSNNYAGGGSSACWGIYGDSHRTVAGAGPGYGAEFDTSCVSPCTSSAADPYQQGDTVGLQIASGGEVPLTGQINTSAAIQIEPNGSQFKQGIVIASGAIASGGFALAVPLNQGIGWYSSAGALQTSLVNNSGVIVSTGSLAVTSAASSNLTFTDTTNSRSAIFGLDAGGFNSMINSSSGGNVLIEAGGTPGLTVNGITTTANLPLVLKQSTVAGLTSCSTATKGELVEVTDAISPSWHGTLSGGGSIFSGAMCNGSNWIAW